jgi:hypothetical protein
MWRTDGSHEAGSEVAKVRWDIVPYMRGRAIDLGCGPYKAFPHFIGVDSGKDIQLFGAQMKPNVWSNVEKLTLFASGEFDCVFSSHTLEHMDDYASALKEWWRLVKVGGTSTRSAATEKSGKTGTSRTRIPSQTRKPR